MLTMSQLSRARVFVPRTPSRRNKKKGTEPRPKKLGRVHALVFSPDSRRVVGLMVKRPDLAAMVRRADRFLALDAFELLEKGILCTKGEESFDHPACERLGIDLDTCIVWGGAEVLTESGAPLGYVMDARFSEASGVVDCFCAQEGTTASALVGSFEIPVAWVLRYEAGRMVVRDEAASLEPSGGLAAKAGEGYEVAKQEVSHVAERTGAAASVALDKGSHGLGRALGKTTLSARKAASEFREASRPNAGKKVESAQPGTSARSAPTDVGRTAARAAGKQLGKTQGMFSGFLNEFKDANK